MQAAQRTQRQGARRSMSGGVLFCTLTRNRSSATKHMSFFSSLPLISPSAAHRESPTNGFAWVSHRVLEPNDHRVPGPCRFCVAGRSRCRGTARTPGLAARPDRRGESEDWNVWNNGILERWKIGFLESIILLLHHSSIPLFQSLFHPVQHVAHHRPTGLLGRRIRD